MRYLSLCLLGLLVLLGSTPASVEAQVLYTEAFASAEHYESVSSHSLGVIWLDYDADGDPDLMATNGHGFGGVHLYRNDGGTFVLDDAMLPTLPNYEYVGAVYADYDNDGDDDVYLYTAHEEWDVSAITNPHDGPPNVLLRNQFVENGGAISEPLFVDVAAAAGVDDCPLVPFGDDYDCFQTRSANWLDYDLDGCVDLYVGHNVMNRPGEEFNRDRLYRNRCDGTFEDVTEASGIQTGTETWRSTLVSMAADFNRDGWTDLYLGHVAMHESVDPTNYNDRLLANQGDGTFEERFVNQLDDTPAAMGIDIADIDGNGTWDIYLTDIYHHELIPHDDGNTLYRQTTEAALNDNQAFQFDVRGGFSWGTNFLDADLDGDSDLFVGVALFGGFESDPPGHEYSALFENTNTAAGFDPFGVGVGLNTIDVRGSAVADYDLDGDLDIAVVNQAGPVQIFRNDTVTSGNYLVVELEATQSNPNAFGAVVEIEAGGRTQIRTLAGGSSSHSQNSRQLHFGLGDATTVDRLEVQWPNGLVQEQTDIEVGHYEITEESDD